MNRIGFAILCLLQHSVSVAAENALTDGRVVFLGDSITNGGHYIAVLDSRLRSAGKETDFINLGLPSETCSGLSEPDHPFTRPDVHERLERALAKAKPDVVFACYGMNDGIYHPFSAERFAAYKAGIEKLIDKVTKSGAKLVLMTPPAFDPLPMRKKGKLLPRGKEKYAWFAIYENYDDEVIARYARWVKQLGADKRVAAVVDLHSPVRTLLFEKRKEAPEYVLSGDGVHLNNDGHAVLADAICKAVGVETKPVDKKLLDLVGKRQRLRHAAWLSHVGHKRPGVKAGLPIDKAEAQAKAMSAEIAILLADGAPSENR